MHIPNAYRVLCRRWTNDAPGGPAGRRECADSFLDLATKQRGRFIRLLAPLLKIGQVTHVIMPFLFASMRMLLGNRFINPVSLAIIMSVQFGLILPA